jgi:hypothetical protein
MDVTGRSGRDSRHRDARRRGRARSSHEASPGHRRNRRSTEVTTTDRDEQSVISSLQYAHNTESARVWRSCSDGPVAAQIVWF